MGNKKLDCLAEEIMDVFELLGFDDTYISDKRDTLAELDRFAVLLWCNNLDQRCREVLARQLGINVDDFSTTIKTLQRLLLLC